MKKSRTKISYDRKSLNGFFNLYDKFNNWGILILFVLYYKTICGKRGSIIKH